MSAVSLDASNYRDSRSQSVRPIRHLLSYFVRKLFVCPIVQRRCLAMESLGTYPLAMGRSEKVTFNGAKIVGGGIWAGNLHITGTSIGIGVTQPKKPSIRLSKVTSLVAMADPGGTVLSVTTADGSTDFLIPRKSPDEVALKVTRFLAGWSPLSVVIGERAWAHPLLPQLTPTGVVDYRAPSPEVAQDHRRRARTERRMMRLFNLSYWMTMAALVPLLIFLAVVGIIFVVVLVALL